MGIYDTYDGIQLKVGLKEDEMRYFAIGDKTTLADGIYTAPEGIVVIVKGIFVAKFDHITTKWGDEIPCKEILEPYSPF